VASEFGHLKVHTERMEEPVIVYSFEVWDQRQGAYVAQRLKSPAERIERIGRSRITPGTAEEVEASMLDPQGRYNPSPGWNRVPNAPQGSSKNC
jgi:hypothetical protein